MEKITADEAAGLVRDGDAILISGSGGGHSVPEALLAAVERRFIARAIRRADLGKHRGGRRSGGAGCKPSCSRGALKRAITSALVDSPGLVRLAAEDRIEAYTFPQGVLSQLSATWRRQARPVDKDGPAFVCRSAPAGRPAKPRTPLDFVEVVNLLGEEWLFFKPVPVNVAFLRGTTADEDGNVTMEEEAVFGEMLRWRRRRVVLAAS